jgi:hypothetical protein
MRKTISQSFGAQLLSPQLPFSEKEVRLALVIPSLCWGIRSPDF